MSEQLIKEDKLSRPWVECSCCNGKGLSQLGDTHWETLQICRELGFPVTVGQVYEVLKKRHRHIGPTALNQRMTHLVKLGFLTRPGPKDGKSHLYFAQNAEVCHGANNESP